MLKLKYYFQLLTVAILIIISCKKNIDNNKVVDRNGNVYNVIKLGSQAWIQENLKVNEFNEGTDIRFVADNAEWDTLQTPAYCWYRNDESQYRNTYGALYNWYAIARGNPCPAGWHIPGDEEWTTLEVFLQNHGFNFDGSVDTETDRYSGNKTAKSIASTVLWTETTEYGSIGNDLSKNNKSSFTAVPAGYRKSDGDFSDLGQSAFFWTKTKSDTANAWYRGLRYYNYNVDKYNYSKKGGFSVRCLKD